MDDLSWRTLNIERRKVDRWTTTDGRSFTGSEEAMEEAVRYQRLLNIKDKDALFFKFMLEKVFGIDTASDKKAVREEVLKKNNLEGQVHYIPTISNLRHLSNILIKAHAFIGPDNWAKIDEYIKENF